MSNNSTQLDLTLRSVESQEFENRLRRNVVGRGEQFVRLSACSRCMAQR
jgi:hypothetical protein